MSIEQSYSALPCHHIILVTTITVASTPGRQNARATYCGRQSAWNRTVPDLRHLLYGSVVEHAVFLKADILCTLSFPTKTSTQPWYIRAAAGGYVFLWDRWRLGLCSGDGFLRPKLGRCPMTGRRLSRGWPPHIGWPISVRRVSYSRSSNSTISHRRLTTLTNL